MFFYVVGDSSGWILPGLCLQPWQEVSDGDGGLAAHDAVQDDVVGELDLVWMADQRSALLQQPASLAKNVNLKCIK